MLPQTSKSILPDFYLFGPETQEESERFLAGHAAYCDMRLKLGLWPHLSPGSTLVAAMGAHWYPHSFEAVRAMCKYTQDNGRMTHFYAEQDRCYEPYDGLGTMRNLAYMRALRGGYEWLLYVDNDILPNPDTLAKLQDRYMPIILPIIRYTDGEDHGIRLASFPEGRGLAVVSSTVLSFVLFRVDVFLPWATVPFWDNARGSDEEYHFLRFAMAGHRPIVDTDQVIQCQNPPHFPFDHIEGKRDWQDLAQKDAIRIWSEQQERRANDTWEHQGD